MDPQTARKTAKWIGTLWPQTITAQQIAQMAATFESPNYGEQAVRQVVDEFYTSKAFFSFAELVERLRIRRETRQWQSDEQRRQGLRQEEWWVRATASVQALGDSELADLLEEVLDAFKPEMRGFYEKKDPRKSRSIIGPIYELIEKRGNHGDRQKEPETDAGQSSAGASVGVAGAPIER